MSYFLCGFFLLSIFLIWKIPIWQLNGKKRAPIDENNLNLENELRKTIAQIIGGLFVLIGLGFTYNQISATRDSINISQERLITDRYSKAIDQLGSNSSQIRLGGIFALEKIAISSPDYASVVKKVLATYIRQKSHSIDSTVFEELQAAVDIISYRDNQANFKIDSADYVNISNVSLKGFELNNALLLNAKMIRSDFSNSNFIKANLSGVTGYEVIFTKANLTNSTLLNANFYGGEFEQTIMKNSILTKVNFQLADLREADLTNCDLTDVNFTEANLTGTILNGDDLSKAIGLTKEQLHSARINSSTKIPSSLK